MLKTGQILEELGYDYYLYTSEAKKPEYSQRSFADFLPVFLHSDSERCRSLAVKRLYRHQEEAFDALRRGSNLVLKSGTGSGKTEAWFLHMAVSGVKVLAVYPTLALANDQLSRLMEYCTALGKRVLVLDASRKSSMMREMGSRGLRQSVETSDVVVTNPALLLNEVKRMVEGKASILKNFIKDAGLVVVDEFDFYGPRSIALLTTMLKLLVRLVNPKLQFTVMTAALQNPEEVGHILTSINQRSTEIVDGKPFHPVNYTYVVLGRSLRKAWTRFRDALPYLRERGVAGDVLDAAESYELFRMQYHKIVSAALAVGIDLRAEDDDISAILERYVEDDTLTIVFTNGIASAEEMARRVKVRLGAAGSVASHHHLLLKSQRAETEDAARGGRLRLVFSPRTLSQGIDIGSVGRVVHLGLPPSVREFRQREGRKGRRPEIEWTETVIIPYGQWDHELLSRGLEALLRWLELPMEHVVVNRDNQYGLLFEYLSSFISPSLRAEMAADQIRFLERLGLVADGELTRKGKNTWLRINFYEFAPPYGIKRRRLRGLEGFSWLEDVSHVDLVEKFQTGCIDYSSDGLVVGHRLAPSKYRVVTEVVVDDLRESVMRHHEALAYVVEEYEKVKSGWGESVDIRGDYYRGRLRSDVQCVVHAPSRGFGLYTKIPNRVEWRVKSAKKRIVTVGDRTLVVDDSRVLEVPAPTVGIYSDYTYGISAEAEPSDDPQLLRLGLALIVIILRRLYNIHIDLFKYDVFILGERKVVALHEVESAGLLPRIDWAELQGRVGDYSPDMLDEVFLMQVDEIAYSSFVSLGLDWELVKSYALRVIRYFRLREMLELKVGGLTLNVRKPSTALKTLTLAVEELTLREDLKAGLYGLAFFDGERCISAVGMRELGQPQPIYHDLLTAISARLDEGFQVVTYDIQVLYDGLRRAGLKTLESLMAGFERVGRVVSLRERLQEVLGESVSLETLEEALGLQRNVDLKELVARREMVRSRVPRLSYIRRIPRSLEDGLRGYLESEARNVYMAWLVYEALRGR